MTLLRTITTIAVKTLVRSTVLTLGLVAYDPVYDRFVNPTPGDADIGKGLLAFMIVILVSLLWALADGMRSRPVVWLPAWLFTAVAVGLAWDPVAQLVDSRREDLETGVDVFIAQLVLWPALLGAGFGWLVVGRTSAARPAPSGT